MNSQQHQFDYIDAVDEEQESDGDDMDIGIDIQSQFRNSKMEAYKNQKSFGGKDTSRASNVSRVLASNSIITS
jgi:hypothetical protein